ncbi:MAG TPA: 3-oxoacyl-[acyl-carrier-protein] reductase [Polyangiales bacterium]|nr:3-oxoacyl-[acyl-carrier-protein] reductase [Polyangiales bacterium]
MFKLDGKVAVVTGGFRGLGRAMAESLGKSGAYVVAADVLPEDVGQETLRVLSASGAKGELKRLDVTNAEQVDETFKELHKRLGRLDIVVNNAGIARDNLLLRVSDEDIQKTFAVNVTGAINCARSAVRIMMRAKTGRIINLASVVAELGNPGQTVYSASKAALIGLTKTLAREYASRGITVNAVAPGFIDTDMTKNLPEDAKKYMLEQIPLARIGKPEDVAAAVLFLSTDEASYITGQVLRVNGGMYV